MRRMFWNGMTSLIYISLGELICLFDFVNTRGSLCQTESHFKISEMIRYLSRFSFTIASWIENFATFWPLCITVTSFSPRWRLKSPASRLFTQTFVHAQIKKNHQSSASLALVRGIHRWPVNSPHKGPVTGKMFPFDDVTMMQRICLLLGSLLGFPYKGTVIWSNPLIF